MLLLLLILLILRFYPSNPSAPAPLFVSPVRRLYARFCIPVVAVFPLAVVSEAQAHVLELCCASCISQSWVRNHCPRNIVIVEWVHNSCAMGDN